MGGAAALRVPSRILGVVEVVGLELLSHHPVIEPVSEIGVGNGIFRRRPR